MAREAPPRIFGCFVEMLLTADEDLPTGLEVFFEKKSSLWHSVKKAEAINFKNLGKNLW